MADREKQLEDREVKTEAQTAAQVVPAVDDTPADEEFVPEGGREAWTVVLGSTLALFASAGMINAYVSLTDFFEYLTWWLIPYCCVVQGTFQDYYESTLLPSSSSASVSLIGSLQIFFLYGLGPVVGRVFDAYGTSVRPHLR